MSKWIEMDAAPWHRPKLKQIAPGVSVTTVYGSHVIAALLYALYRKVRSLAVSSSGENTE